MNDECEYNWEDENGTEHHYVLNVDSTIHEKGGHGCTCGERIDADYDDEDERWY